MKTLKTAKRKFAQNTYSTEVAVSVASPGTTWFVSENDPKARVNFILDLDIREWGIKDILMIPQGIVQINYVAVVEATDSEEHRTIQVDLSQLKVDLTEGRAWTLGELTISLDDQGQVDYGRSYIQGYFIGDPI